MADELIADPDDDEPVHTHFGLTYANYLVLPRTLMQSMPVDWQRRIVACIDELHDTFAHIDQAPAYEVHAAREVEYRDLTREQMDQLGVRQCLGQYYDRGGEAHSGWERTLIPIPDPVPHYNRGRTRIEPQRSAQNGDPQ